MTLAAEVGLEPDVLVRLLATLADAAVTVAAAESLTAGLLTAVLTETPGSSAVVRGGLVVYATDLKASLAGVSPELLARHGPVHPQVARQLAEGARTRCGATVGIGLTGVAGPDPQGGAAVGTVHLALVAPGWQRAESLSADKIFGPGEGEGLSAHTRGDAGAAVRARVRAAAVRQAVALLAEYGQSGIGGGRLAAVPQ